MLWLGVCFLLCITIMLIGYELVYTPNSLQGNYKESLCQNFTNENAPAKRLVIFLVDAMGNYSANQSWMSKVINERSYGYGEALAAKPVTRAGLVAIFAGYYENILSYMPLINLKKVNDSIFRHVTNTLYFGPEIVKHYFKGGKLWSGATYLSDMMYEVGQEHIGDDYTMDAIKMMFNNPNGYLINATKIFYIHFTSVDIIGKLSRRGSDRVEKAIDKVARMTKEAVKLFDKYFEDNQTVFMILSDHGMTKWGTHADSLPEEITTSVILWGEQISTGLHRSMQQIDLCPLIAALLGTVVPSKSLGLLRHEYLNASVSSLAHSFMCTALQQAELCKNTWDRIEEGLLVKHVLGRTMSDCIYQQYINTLEKQMTTKDYKQVLKTSAHLMRLSRDCIENIQNFYKSSLLFVLVMSYFAWIFGTVCMIATNAPDKRFTSCAGKLIVFVTCFGYVAMSAFSISSIILENLPLYYVFFIIIPSTAWLMTTLKTGICITKLMNTKPVVNLLYVVAVLAMVEFTYWAKYYPFMFACYLMPYASLTVAITHKYVPYHVSSVFLISCTVLVIVPSFPVIGLPGSPILLNISAVLWIVGSCFFGYALDLKAKQCLVSLAMTAVACLSTWIIDLSYLGSNLLLKILSWCILPFPLVSFCASANLAERLLQVIISMGGPYLLLSTRHEPIVLLVFALNLYSLLRIEASSPQYPGQNFVRGINLHYYTVLGIIATGNVPYLSSFDILITRLFTSSPDDIHLAILTIYKITIVLTLIVCFFCTICLYIGGGLRVMLMITTVTAAISSARHCFGIIISDDPIHKLPEFFLGNILYLILLIPFTLAPVFVNVKKEKK